MARSELHLLITQILLMLIVIIPTFIFLFVTVRQKSPPKKWQMKQSILWLVPTSVIAIMAVVTWQAAHKLDPYQPLKSEFKPLTIQVVALDWKWLFIYPEQGIATLNYVQFPAAIPIHFTLAADGSPMNSFWIPQLSGQIYSMSGMSTSLHLMADGPGQYTGRAAEINGKGYADMTFVVRSSSTSDFEDWVGHVKQSSEQLTEATYSDLIKPSIKNPITFYSSVENNLYHKIMMKYMDHP
jgi:cytochrome o ubiquinol oxidase subunit 2